MWDGVFFKSLNIRFIPLLEMTAEDWRWLDFRNIRPVAKDRIADKIVNGTLVGFFDIRIVEKAAKDRYEWPATGPDVKIFEETGKAPFVHSTTPVVESIRAMDLEETAGRIGRLVTRYGPVRFTRAATALATIWANELYGTTAEQEVESEEEAAEVEERINRIDDLLTSLDPFDMGLLFVILWFRQPTTLEELEELLENLEDEVDRELQGV